MKIFTQKGNEKAFQMLAIPKWSQKVTSPVPLLIGEIN